MPLFSALLKSPQTNSPPPVAPRARDDRAAERFEVCQSVSIGRPGAGLATGSVISLSVTGAAIRVDGWNMSRAEWLSELEQGDELWVEGLLAVPISCWAVVSDEGLLRVHFSREEAERQQLRGAIARLAATTV
jgi:hypothetical protein